MFSRIFAKKINMFPRNLSVGKAAISSVNRRLTSKNAAIPARLSSKRFLSSSGEAASSHNKRRFMFTAGGAAIGLCAYIAFYYSKKYLISNEETKKSSSLTPQQSYHATTATKLIDDYQKIYNVIAQKIQDEDEYDGGIGYGPSLVRLSWHLLGTYDKNDNTDTRGGSFGGTIYHKYESSDDANNGLDKPRKFLDSIHQQFPWLSRGDLVTLAGVTAVQEMQGPKIYWRPGRVNQLEKFQPPHGRLPDGSQGATHVREVFHRLSDSFKDEEIAALVGVGHAIGRCHKQNSTYDGPWTFSPNIISNQFFVLLLNEDWHVRDWDGPAQMEDVKTKSLMMLPADFSFRFDPAFLKVCKVYAEDQDKLFEVFSSAFAKLLELGIEFPAEQKKFQFKTLDEQED